jgi:RHS repeat-associated protein
MTPPPDAAQEQSLTLKWKSLALVAGALLLMGASLPSHAQVTPTTFTEQYKAIKAPGALSRLGPDLFGDSVNLYNGGLTFAQNDVTLRGNSALQVAFGRRLTAGQRGFDDRALGRWDIDIPHMYGTFANGYLSASQGWRGRDGSNNRCSQFGAPPEAKGLQGSSTWAAKEFWQGSHMYIPGKGDHRLLRRDLANANTPSAMTVDGVSISTFPVVTSSHWSIGCLPGLANDPSTLKPMGQGFLAVSPDGTRYKFDQMVTFQATTLRKSTTMAKGVMEADTFEPADHESQEQEEKAKDTNALSRGDALTPTGVSTPTLPRMEVWILPTKIIDRYGNSVTYTYDPAKPANVTKIESSDGRVLNITYEIVNGITTQRVKTVSDGMRTWTYSYHYPVGKISLDRVTLPDGSFWDFAGADGMLEELAYMSDPSYCDEHKYPLTTVRSGTMVHPSGAVGTFTLTPTEHGRSGVQYWCSSKYLVTPIFFHSNSLTRKSISGPGLSTLNWNYNYGVANGSFLTCTNCPTTKNVSVTDPKGNVNRYTFGNQLVVSEGKLQRTEIGWNGSTALRTTEIHTRPTSASNPYPAQAGTSDDIYGDGGTDQRHYPEDRRTITQQGVTFTWAVDEFDFFVRATKVTRSSSIGLPRTETTVFKDIEPIWVLGLVEKVNLPVGTGSAVENTFHPNGDLLSEKKFGVLQSTLNYYADGTLYSYADGKGQATTFSNYRAGLPQRIDFPDGSFETAEVNNNGYILWTRDAAGFRTDFGHDAAGRVSLISPPATTGGASTATQVIFAKIPSAEYDLSAGHWRRDVTTGNARSRIYYDAMWRPMYEEKWDATNVAGTMSASKQLFDADGKTAFQSYPKNSVSLLGTGVYHDSDALGRHTESRQDSELGILYQRSAYLDHFVKSTTNARDITTLTKYQVFDEPVENAIVEIVAPEGVNVNIARDILGKPLSITRSGGGKSASRTYVYDLGSQRLCKTIEPETNSTIQDYDLAGNIAWRATGLALPSSACDLASVPPAAKITFGYDTLNRNISTSFGDSSPSIVRTYTPDGLPLTVNSNGSNWLYDYNSRRQLESEKLTYGGVSYAILRAYDANGSLTQLTYPDNAVVTYNPDALGRATQVGSYASAVTYYPNGAVKGFTYGNGITHSLEQYDRGLPRRSIDSGGVLNDLYSYDKNGNVVGIQDDQLSISTRNMIYDNLDRLSQASAPNMFGTANYAYDAIDNITGSSVTLGAFARSLTHYYDATTNRLASLSGTAALSFTYGYDSQGNITQRGGQTYSFDIANRMKSAPGRATYSYDGWNRRVSVVGNDGLDRLQVYAQDGKILFAGPTTATKTKYVYLNNHVVAEVVAATPTYLHTDGLGSPVARTDAATAIQSRTRYEPFGSAAAGATPTIGFTGHVSDVETGLTYMQQRYYDPIAGRFLSIDPVTTDANTGSAFNRYAYADNSPYRYIDPDGRSPQEAGQSQITKNFKIFLGSADPTLSATEINSLAVSTESFVVQNYSTVSLLFDPVTFSQYVKTVNGKEITVNVGLTSKELTKLKAIYEKMTPKDPKTAAKLKATLELGMKTGQVLVNRKRVTPPPPPPPEPKKVEPKPNEGSK